MAIPTPPPRLWLKFLTFFAQVGLVLACCRAAPVGETLPLTATRSIRYSAHRGTWMSVDVAPNGRHIVFDLVGDLYSLPIGGGKAIRLTKGPSLDSQPRYSPDGRWIVFTSDRAGVDDIWLMSTTADVQRQLTHNDGTALYISPSWTRDSRSIVFSKRKRGRTTISELGLADGLEREITAGAEFAGKNYLGPVMAPDGDAIYVAEQLDVRLRGRNGLWRVVAVKTDGTVRAETSTGLASTGVRPLISPNGRYLVYGSFNGTGMGLVIRDLQSDRERCLVKKAQFPTSWWSGSPHERDLLPGSAFTPDSASLITSYEGKLWKIDIRSGERTNIPFVADVEQALGPPVEKRATIDDRWVTIRLTSDPALSPDGSRVAFSAMDRTWVMDLPSGIPRRLTSGSATESHPSWSRDGRSVAYASWDDKDGGAVIEVGADGSSAPHRLTDDGLYYTHVSYAPDNTNIVAIRGPKELHYYGPTSVYRAFDVARRPLELEIVALSRVRYSARRIGRIGADTSAYDAYRHGSLSFDSSGTVYLHQYGKGLVRYSLDGLQPPEPMFDVTANESALFAEYREASDIVMSPDCQHALALFKSGEVFLLSFTTIPTAGQIVSVDSPPAGVHVERVSAFGGDYATWTVDGRVGCIGLGSSLFLISPRASNGPAHDTSQVEIHLRLPADSPPSNAAVVLRGARVITMRGNEVIPNGDVVMRGNRLVAVGKHGQVAIPADADIIYVQGKTILPGFVDVHCHVDPAINTHASGDWRLKTWLSYGVTTIRDPASQSQKPDILTYADRITTGDMIGPRVFTTLGAIHPSRSAYTLAAMQESLRAYSDFYKTDELKNKLNRGRRVQQLLAITARQAGLLVDNEGWQDTALQLSYVLDGFIALQHSYPTLPMQEDLLQLLARAGVYQTFTLGTEAAATQYYLRRYPLELLPEAMTAYYPRFFRSQLAKADGYELPLEVLRLMCEQPARLVKAGGRIGIGSHGDVPGIGYHFEMWAHALGGMDNHDILRAATIWGAQAIGHGLDLGSVEPEKLADLVILDENPLVDIHSTVKLNAVIKNGRLYTPFTAEEIPAEPVEHSSNSRLVYPHTR